VAVGETHARLGQEINIRRQHIVRTKRAHVPETEVVNVEQDNVGSLEVLTRDCRTPEKKRPVKA